MPRAPHRLVVVLACLVTLLLGPAVKARAAVDPMTAPDFATTTYGDAWDFSNADDFGEPLRGWTREVDDIVVQNGMLSATFKPSAQFALVRGFSEITIPWGRDGSLLPIDASKFTRLSFRLNSQTSRTLYGQITWMTCGTLRVTCEGGQPIKILPGWNTYDVLLRNAYPELPSQWAGSVQSLTLSPVGGPTPVHMDIDWIRLYDPTGSGSAAPRSLLPRDPVSGGDYASIERGDPWDFSNPSDGGTITNASVYFDGQTMHGQNAGPNINDPKIVLPAPVPIDGTRYHRFSMRIFFDGVFSLEDNVGGGMNARVLWYVAGSNMQQTSQDILIYPGWQTVNFDMAYPGVLDETQESPRLGWAGQTITEFRVDPDEDRGPRNWIIDWVRLGSDAPFGAFDTARVALGGIYVAGWSIDPNTAASNTVHVYVDNTAYAIDAKRVRSDVAGVFPGFGAAHGFGAVVPASRGTHQVCAYAINLGPGDNSLIGCKQVVVNGVPFGWLDDVRRVAGGYHVAGWAIDPDTASPIPVHVYVDSQPPTGVLAAGDRTDVAAVYPRYGALHGFEVTVGASPGLHNVCVYAINNTAGDNPSLGCRVV